VLECLLFQIQDFRLQISQYGPLNCSYLLLENSLIKIRLRKGEKSFKKNLAHISTASCEPWTAVSMKQPTAPPPPPPPEEAEAEFVLEVDCTT
jgi:hypothetical protein